MLNMQRDIAFEVLEAEIKDFLGSYPITWIGKRPETWQEDKMGEVRQDLSDALVRCGQLMERLRALGSLHKNYAELVKTLLETRSRLQREFERYEFHGLGIKGIPCPQFGIYSKPSRRLPERVPDHLKKG